MASHKEAQATRPLSSHRLSMGSMPSANTPLRQPTSRHHSQSLSLGVASSSHRVTRRKSMNSGAGHGAAAMKAALQEDGQGAAKCRSFNLKNMASVRGLESSNYTGSSNDRLETNDMSGHNVIEMNDDESAIADDFLPVDNINTLSKAKARRASEGSHLTKGENKRSSGELRCEKCGKNYKHSSCLTKHLWEHTPEWSYTSKLLISKHQQVQLLEAASVLVGMNQDEPAEVDNMKTSDSDHSSASPAASGYSDIHDDEDYASAETTPPPMSDHYGLVDGVEIGRGKRYSGNSSSFSRSYQSAPSSSLPAGSAFSHFHQQRRPSTSGVGSVTADEDEAGLAAAVETLCTFGTPRNGPVLLPADVPPVPPLPARYAEENVSKLLGQLEPVADFGLAQPSYQRLSNERDVKMDDEQHNDNDDFDDHSTSHGMGDVDYEGMFGNMEGVSHQH